VVKPDKSEFGGRERGVVIRLKTEDKRVYSGTGGTRTLPRKKRRGKKISRVRITSTSFGLRGGRVDNRSSGS